MTTRLLLLLAALLLITTGCGSDGDPQTEADTSTSSGGEDTSSSGGEDTSSSGGEDTGMEDVSEGCSYPAGHDGFVNLGKIMPELSWETAYIATDGTKTSFSLEEFYCNPEYDKYNVAMFFITAEWCPACHEMLAMFGNDGTFDELETEGALIINVEAQTTDYTPSPSDHAYTSITAHAESFAGMIVGDGDTFPATDPTVLTRTNLMGSYPGGFVVRRSDMLVISKLTNDGAYIDLRGIARDPDAFWDGNTPNTDPTCDATDEEASEPANNEVAGAAVLEFGEFTHGGICDDQPDFYKVEYGGNWLLDLQYEASNGDLDFYIWDEEANDYYVGPNGQRLGSAEPGSNGVFQFQGQATIVIFGYNGSTAPYRLALVSLD